MVKYVKATLLIQDDVYDALVREAKSLYGNAKSTSALINDILRRHLATKKSLWGSTKPFDNRFMRDKKDRIL